MFGIKELDGKERSWKEKKDLPMFGKKNNKGFNRKGSEGKENLINLPLSFLPKLEEFERKEIIN